MRLCKHSLIGICLSLITLSSCEKGEENASRVEVHNTKESSEGNLTVLRGEIKYTKVSNDFMYQEAASGEKKIHRDKILSIIKEITNEMALMPEMAILLDGLAEIPCATIERFRKNVLSNVDIRLNLESMGFEKRGGLIVQNTGQTRMSAIQSFAATRHLVKDEGSAQVPVVNINLQPAIFSNISLSFLNNLNDSQELRATIAHELGHLFFEYTYPAIAHSKKTTAAGYCEGEAMSEGAALLVEQTYLRKHYGYELGSAIFEKFHPFNNEHAPYGNYAAYFRDTFTENAPGFADNYPMMVAELLVARNNVIVSEIVLDYAETNKQLNSWKNCTTPTYMVVNQQNRVAGSITGYVRIARTEHALSAATGKDQKQSRSTKRCTEEVAALEQITLDVNNAITGRALTSLFTAGDRIDLIVHDNANGVNQMSTEALALFYVNGTDARIPQTTGRTTSSIIVNSAINVSTTEPDYNKLLSDMRGSNITADSDANSPTAGMNLEQVHKIIKSSPAITRNGTIVHELSHLYFARNYPTTREAQVREGYAMYAELCYYAAVLSNLGYNENDCLKYADDILKLKYTLDTTVPTDVQHAQKQQFALFSSFVSEYLTTSKSQGLLMLNTDKLNSVEGSAIKQRYNTLLR